MESSAVSRLFRLLDYVAQGGATTNLSELSRQADINRVTASRLMSALEDEGMLEALPQGGHRIGVRFLGLAADALARDDLTGHGRRLVALLSKQLAWSSYLVELDGSHAVYLVREIPQTPLVSNIRPGSRLPAYLMAPGRVIMARRPEHTWRDMYDAAKGDVPAARMSFREVARLLKEARGQDCVWSFGLFEQGIDACAAPVFDAFGAAIAAISAAGPSYHLAGQPKARQQIEAAVLAAAAQLSQLLGYAAAGRS
jgi:DNA-binding IclR family transcriptional regulator